MAKIIKADGMNKCIGCYSCMLSCSCINYKHHSLEKSAIKIKTSGGLSGKFTSTVCVACKDERACLESCPSKALEKRSGGGVILNEEVCIGCKKCVSACIVGAISFDEESKKPIICKHCGICTKFCPHACLRMEEVDDDL
ncbi:[Fe-S]-binding protein [Crassaminicella thermophila]|uniref:[Fe-S]-binding protein n=1 Tax=Crassaminicella thermophila TaxID=2599308 RepID=A0A5C0SGS0_CRATE|nr:4Fe-4S binding protein [Crassaminicella thermophila]QEK12418.1 [Fe-S]-binding protein [Crassaminicella thermophila]